MDIAATLKHLASLSEKEQPPVKERAAIVYYLTACLAAQDEKGNIDPRVKAKLLETMNASRGDPRYEVTDIVTALKAVDAKSDFVTLATKLGEAHGTELTQGIDE